MLCGPFFASAPRAIIIDDAHGAHAGLPSRRCWGFVIITIFIESRDRMGEAWAEGLGGGVGMAHTGMAYIDAE